MTTRVPSCPDCKEPAIPVKGNYFRCPDCGRVWEEVGWKEKIEAEEAAMEAAKALDGVNSLLAFKPINCDKCGRAINYCEKYCYDTKEAITEIINSHEETRGARYCKECSLKAGFLKMVRHRLTNREYAVKFVNEMEMVI